MADHHFWLPEAPFARLQPPLPTQGRGVPRVDDRRVSSGIIPILRTGLMGRDALACSGPPKTLYTRFVRWSQAGIFNRLFAALASDGGTTAPVMSDAPHLQAPRPAGPSPHKGALVRGLGRPRVGSTRHSTPSVTARVTPCCCSCRPGSDDRGGGNGAARPAAEVLSADQGDDRDWFRSALAQRAITPCIPGRANRKQPVSSEAALSKQRNRSERRCGRLKDWRRIATHSDRCAQTFFSAGWPLPFSAGSES